MKNLFIALLLLIAFKSYALDYINDNYDETNTSAIHSYGLFTYGFHSNTFHLRNFYFRYNYSFPDLQFFITLNGYKDTHIPETNYNFILNNINLYDYGVYYKLFDYFFLSLRGAAVYKMNMDSLLLLPAYYSSNNPGEFDSPVQYIPNFITAPGIRIGYKTDHIEIGYSQGDYRHAIPMGAIIKYSGDNYYFQTVFQRVNSDPLTYDINNFYIQAQPSLGLNYNIGEFLISGIFNFTWIQKGDMWLSAEEGLTYKEVTFALRELVPNNKPGIFEFSVKKSFYSIASLGFFAATDGRFYAGTEIKF